MLRRRGDKISKRLALAALACRRLRGTMLVYHLKKMNPSSALALVAGTREDRQDVHPASVPDSQAKQQSAPCALSLTAEGF